jgi:GNAT superfamily N-acetyltransferase
MGSEVPANLPTIDTVVTYMAMTARPRRPARPAPSGKFALLRAEAPTVAFYRFLYNGIGEAWQWTDRRVMADEDLAAIIRDPHVEIFVLYVAGVPAGYAELDFRAMPAANLNYFGLFPEFVGRGLGGWFLDWAVRAMWDKGPERITVDTCNMDHPRALQAYQRAGFEVVRREHKPLVPIEAVRAMGL